MINEQKHINTEKNQPERSKQKDGNWGKSRKLDTEIAFPQRLKMHAKVH